MLTGPDVSHWQGPIDWLEVARAGHTFGWAKATEGRSVVDSRFRANWAGMQAARLVRGAYHFLRSENDPAVQARHFVDVVGDLSGSLAALDVETSAAETNPTVDHARAFVDEFARLTDGHPLLIYSGRWYWVDRLGDPYGADLGPLWHSRYRADPGAMYGGWPTWAFWQHTDAAQIPGITGGCDLNRFDGELRHLHALTGQPLEDDMPNTHDELVAAAYEGCKKALDDSTVFGEVSGAATLQHMASNVQHLINSVAAGFAQLKQTPIEVDIDEAALREQLLPVFGELTDSILDEMHSRLAA